MIHEHDLYALSEAFHHSAPSQLQIGNRDERYTESSRSETCTVYDEVTGDVYRVVQTVIVEQLAGIESLQAELALRIERKDAAAVARLRDELQPHAWKTDTLLAKAATL